MAVKSERQLPEVPDSTSTDVFGLRPEVWDVIGTIVTSLAFLAAAAAAWVAYRQLKANQAARLDQSRPYVMVTADNNPSNPHILDVVIQNVGNGPARDVSISVDPPLKRAKGGEGYELANSRLFTEPIPVLPPDFKMRTFFDTAIDRNGAEVPATHGVTLSYHDGHGHRWDESSVLDFSLHDGLLYTETYTIHHIGKALRDMLAVLKKSKTLTNEPLHVAVEGRDEYVARRDRSHQDHRRAIEAAERRMREASDVVGLQEDQPSASDP